MGDSGSQTPAPLPGPPAVSPAPDGHGDIDPSASQLCWVLFAHRRAHVCLCWCRVTTVTATNPAWLRPPGFKDHPEMCCEMGLHSGAEPVGPAWHPVPSPDCHLELDLELPLHGDRDRQLAPSRDLGCSRAQAGTEDKRCGWTLAWSGGTGVAQQLQAVPSFRSTELVSPLTHSFRPLVHVQRVPLALPHTTALRPIPLGAQGCHPPGKVARARLQAVQICSVTQNTLKQEGSEVWAMLLAWPVWQRPALGSSPRCAMLARVHLAPGSPRADTPVRAGKPLGSPGEKSVVSGMGLYICWHTCVTSWPGSALPERQSSGDWDKHCDPALR